MPGIGWHVGQAVVPLRVALSDRGAMEDLLHRLGYQVTLNDDARAAAADLFDIADELAELADALAALHAGTGDAAAHSVTILRAASEIAAATQSLASLTAADITHLPEPLDDRSTWAELAADLTFYLLTEYLRQHAGGLFAMLGLSGVLTPPHPVRSSGDQRLKLDFARLTELVTAPGARLAAQFGWGGGFNAAALLWWARELCDSLGIAAEVVPIPEVIIDDVYRKRQPSLPALAVDFVQGTLPDGSAAFTAGALVSTIGTASDPAGDPVGVYVGPTLWGAARGRIGLGGPWWLDVAADLDASGLTGLSIRPESITHETAAPAPSGTIAFEYLPAEPLIVLGGAGVALKLHGLRMAVSSNAALEPAVEVETLGDGLELSIDGGEADNFIGALLGSLDLSVRTPLGLDVTKGAIRLRGGIGFETSVPLDLSLGPATIRTMYAALGANDGAVSLEGLLDIEGALGPFTISFGGIGARVELVEGEDALGLGVELRGGFVPPTRLGMQIRSESVSGGGLIEIDPERGRYSGVLSLDIVGVGIDALMVVDTQLPGDPNGWALFATLTAAFPGIPLGFGFTLQGVGGLLALNRTMDAEALSAGLRSGAIDSLLFPDDPIGDSAEIIAGIDEYFPILAGNTVVGPILKVGWGSPTLITAKLGIIISLPDALIAVMGSVEALIPVPEAPLLTLRMDVLGVIDLAEGTFALTGSLYDSRLLETIALSGDMAMYLQLSRQPYFLLSVGGFHPGFEPPSIVPASMRDLRRMQAGIAVATNVSVSLQSYFALTSNSVQFGASVNVEASVEIWPATYTARGWFGFDVLLVFSPFKIVASMSAGVGIYSGNKELMGVQLAFELEGPKPWFATGYASFKFFGIRVGFELEVGSRAAGEPRPIAHPRSAVLAALRLPASWSETAPADGLAAGITYTSSAAEDDGVVWVRPDHQVTVRQSVAPLNRRIEIVGQAIPAPGEDLMTVTDAGFTGASRRADWYLANDWFAPAQFEVTGRTDKLSRASFEEMTAGVSFGAPGVAITNDPDALGTSVTTGHEEGSLGDSVRTGAAAAGLRHRQPGAVTPRFSIAPTTYTVARSADGVAARMVLPGGGNLGVSQYDAAQARNLAIASDDSEAARLVVVPFASALGPAS